MVTKRKEHRSRPSVPPGSSSSNHTVFRIGISGWSYTAWRGQFYPTGLSQGRELEYASRVFNTIEINGSFYSLQLPSSYRKWFTETPEGFLFSVKGSRYISHMKRLRDIRIPLANFFASGLLALGEKLGPILWQFPPQFRWNKQKFADFFDLLPTTTKAAEMLARKHDQKLKAKAFLKTDAVRRLRYAVEIRHPSFLVPDFFQLLRKHNIAFVVADTAKKWPYAEELTADFIYVRLHGAEELYVSGYNDGAIQSWARRIQNWGAGSPFDDAKLVDPTSSQKITPREIFVYFDNDAKVHAPFDAQRLAREIQRCRRFSNRLLALNNQTKKG